MTTTAATSSSRDVTSELAYLTRVLKAPALREAASRLAERATNAHLTPREVQVIELISQGMRNKEIAAALGISFETAQVHVKNILGKLKVQDRTAAVSVAAPRTADGARTSGGAGGVHPSRPRRGPWSLRPAARRAGRVDDPCFGAGVRRGMDIE